jgi:NAD(P)-dependent dehydrogenase (short-subunit alcohol dehydrogenase family)
MSIQPAAVCRNAGERHVAGELEGKVAIVTGGAGGIGGGTVKIFAEQGAKVVIADVNAERGEALAAELGSVAAFKRTDVSKAEDVQALVDFTVDKFGGLHVMFNNTGINPATPFRCFADDDLADFQHVVGVNLLGIMLGTQRAARHMAKHGGGSIINTGSVGGALPGWGIMSYRVTKAAVIHFTKCTAIEYGQDGIRVNCINPGVIMTEMISFPDPTLTPELREKVSISAAEVITSGQTLKSYGGPEDIGYAALYFASDRSRQVTGVALNVDGGHTAGDNTNYMDGMLNARARIIAENS